jgi:hypothetical protein
MLSNIPAMAVGSFAEIPAFGELGISGFGDLVAGALGSW